jgi:hypothetical protein
MDYSSHLRRSFVCGRALGSLAGNVDAGEGLVQACAAAHFSPGGISLRIPVKRGFLTAAERIWNDPKNIARAARGT